MDYYGSQLGRLIEQLSSLPGIGSKTAQRLAFHIVNMPVEKVQALSDSIISAKKNVRYCKECFTMTDQELCPICGNPKRNHRMIMVVENTRDLAAYEKTGKYEGVYHVLHGAISPMLGIGPGDIRLKELMTRLQGDVDEVLSHCDYVVEEVYHTKAVNQAVDYGIDFYAPQTVRTHSGRCFSRKSRCAHLTEIRR